MGQAGAAFFVGPTAIENHLVKRSGVAIVERIDAVRQQIYVITNERKLTHPVISAICDVAQHNIFGSVAPKAKPGQTKTKTRARARLT